MKHKDLLPMNLQFFGEDEGGDVSETGAVDQSEGTEAASKEPSQETEGETEVPTEPQFQTEKANAAFANFRRENDALKKQLAEYQELDKMFATQFGKYNNPETGKSVDGIRGYYDAFAAQQKLEMQEQLRQNNIDPQIIDRMIADSPAVRAAEAATRELGEIKAQQTFERDAKEVLALDPTLNSIADLNNDPKLPEILEKVNAGLSLVEAYKIVNFDRLTGVKAEAAKQATVNQVKAKNHLTTGTSLDVGDSGEDIPAHMLEMYKESFPGRPMAELKALYNKALSARR